MFKAKGAKTVADIIKAPGQFAGFEGYPKYENEIVRRIQERLDIANDGRDKRNGDFAAFISIAFDVVNGPPISDPSPGTLAAWKAEGHRSPKANFKLYKTIMGNSFYYIPKSVLTPDPGPKRELGDFPEPSIKHA